jgi:hypothetical protein
MSQTPDQPPKKHETIERRYAPAKRTWRRKLAGSVRSWSRATFSRESYMSSLRSLLWVVPLTVLIWIYAEREQVVTVSNVTISVDPPPGIPGHLLVRFAPGTIHSIHADLSGSQALVENVKDMLQSNTVPLESDRDLSAGNHTIDVATVLNRDPRVQSKGVRILRCAPAELVVIVENIREATVDVKARPEDLKGLPPPLFSQAKVKVTLPEGDMIKAEQEDRLYVYPNLKPYSEVLAQMGAHNLVNVALLPAFDNPTNTATISPNSVNVTITRPNGESSYTVPTMSVFASYPPKNERARKFEADYTPTISSITLIGPDDKIRVLREGRQEGAYTVHASFDVDVVSTEVPGQKHIAPLNFVLPLGMRVEANSTPKTIDYTLVPRPPANQ